MNRLSNGEVESTPPKYSAMAAIFPWFGEIFWRGWQGLFVDIPYISTALLFALASAYLILWKPRKRVRLPAFPVYIVGAGSPSLVAIKHTHDGRIGIPVFSSPDDAAKFRNAADKTSFGMNRQHVMEQINSLDHLFNRMRELQRLSEISSIVVNPKPKFGSFDTADWIPISELEGPTDLPSSPT